MITWLNEYASAVQALAAVISVILAIVTVGVALHANKRAIKNQEELRIHSSPKPFLQLIGVQMDHDQNHYVAIRNLGPGIAIKVSICGNFNSGKGEEVIQFEGDNVFPVSSDEPGNKVRFYNCTKRVGIFLPEKMIVTVSYESDSGYKRVTKWTYSLDSNGRHCIELLESN